MFQTAQVQYAHPQKQINIVKMFAPPVRISSVDAWFKAACKAIPEIPETWYRVDELITDKTIVFELINRTTHEKCAVVIARKK